MNEYQKRLPIAIAEHWFRYRGGNRRPFAIRLTPTELRTLQVYMDLNYGDLYKVEVGPTETRFLGMRVIEVATWPSSIEERFVYEGEPV